ncbi:MAG: hypothetical protein WBF52_01795, partial [Geitlerinemataceae cyanobacterium]
MTQKTDLNRIDPLANQNGNRPTADGLTAPSTETNGENLTSPDTDNLAQGATDSQPDATGQLMWRSIPHLDQKWQGLTLRRQLLTWILPGVLVPLGLAGLLGYTVTAQKAIKNAQEQLEGQMLIGSDAANEWLLKIDEVPALIAANPLAIQEARASIEQVQADNLDELPIEELEKQFAETLLLKPNQALNDYLKRSAQIGNLAEIFFTNQYGFNVANIRRPSDFFQRDEA